MSKILTAILASENTWRMAFVHAGRLCLHEVELPDLVDPVDIADRIGQALREEEISHEDEIVLTIPSRWGLAVTVPQVPEGRRWREPMRYALEEYLPVAAEDVVTDFVVNKDRTFAVASLTARLAVLVDTLEARGVLVGWICPSALLALQNWLGRQEVQPDMALLPEDDSVNMIVLKAGRPTAWRLAPASTEEVVEHVGGFLPVETPEDDEDASLQILTPGGEKSLSEAIRALPGVAEVVESTDDCDLALWAARQTQCITRGKSKPWINLRQDSLAPSGVLRTVRWPLVAATAGMAVLLLSLCVGFLWNASRYETLLREAETRKQQAYRKALPESSGGPKRGVERKLKIAMRSLGNTDGRVEGVERPPSSLLVLQDVLEGMAPEKVLFRVKELKIESGRVHLKIHADSEKTVGRVIKSLNRAGRLTLDLGGSVKSNEPYNVNGKSLRESAGRP